MNNRVNNIKSDKKRFIEIDVAKGIAVLLMVIFHYFYLGKHMGIFDADTDKGMLQLSAQIAHTTFIIASGANLAISTSGKSSSKYVPKKIKRGLQLIMIGLIISYLTRIEFGDSYVRFGIMHFLGVATIISSLLMRSPISTYIGSALILLSHIMLKYPSVKDTFRDICRDNPLTCLISGVMNVKYYPLDHFPLIPSLGYFLLGSSIAFICYRIITVRDNVKDVREIDDKACLRRISILGILDDHADNPLIKGLAWMGQRSLSIYIIHFVILYCIFKYVQISRKRGMIISFLS